MFPHTFCILNKIKVNVYIFGFCEETKKGGKMQKVWSKGTDLVTFQNFIANCYDLNVHLFLAVFLLTE